MACTFINVKGSSENCKETFSGVGSVIYLVNTENVDAQWDLSEVSSMDNYVTTIQAFLLGSGYEAVEVHIKPKSGKVTSSNNPNGGGFTNVFTGVVANNMKRMSELARSLNNTNDWGAIIPCSNGAYYIYDKDFGVEFQLESDTGDTPDSDHGHTLTITCDPMLYPLTLGDKPTTLSIKKDSL